MTDTKNAVRLASAAVAGLVIGGGAMLGLSANADSTTASPTPSASTGSQGTDQGTDREGCERGGGPMRGTEVTGDELTKVSEAVTAKDADFTVERVMKDDQGAYHVMGTKDGDRAGYEVSKDLKTVTEHTPGDRGGRGGKGGPGGHEHTDATDAETTQVTEAVKAKDSTVTVESVQKDPDGSFDVRGTKDGSPVMVEVSKDLKTVDVRTGGDRGMGGRNQQGKGQQNQGQQDQGSTDTQPSASSSETPA
ncbi:hypothetical protein ACTQ49_07280 [Luteococcus sp. Sow4_B9]|uniref:hypothetical protein n=1 Tax=Luteococcus sp. Sow4_B9 TaxID=3438792 RepID=UPI003F9B7476